MKSIVKENLIIIKTDLYTEYFADVTDEVKLLFGNVLEKAVLSLYRDSTDSLTDEELQNVLSYFNELFENYEVSKTFSFDNLDLYLKFSNGHSIQLCNSEFASMNSTNMAIFEKK